MQCFMCYLLVVTVAQASGPRDSTPLHELAPTTDHQPVTSPRIYRTIQLTSDLDLNDQRTTPQTKRNKPKLPPHRNKEPVNTMAGDSHIGNVKSQSVVKPTIIVNIKGASNNIQSRYVNKPVRQEEVLESLFNNEFNINQRIKFDGLMGKVESRHPLKQAVVYDFKG